MKSLGQESDVRESSKRAHAEPESRTGTVAELPLPALGLPLPGSCSAGCTALPPALPQQSRVLA